MKKILLFIMCLMPGVVFAGPCGISEITLSGMGQYPDDDEFLFDSMTAYNSAPTNNGKHTINGKVWECDNEFCSHGKKVTLGPGHVFEGVEIQENRIYTCKTNGMRQSHWEYEEESKMCGETHISYDGNQKPADDEFLYSTKSAYDSVKSRPDGGTVAGGIVYECDNDHCLHNAIQSVPANHVFKGKIVKEPAKYRCISNFAGDDRWQRIYEGCQWNGGLFDVGEWFVDGNDKRLMLTYGECSQFQDMNPADQDKKFYAKCESVGGENKIRCYPVDGMMPIEPDPEKPDPEKPDPEKPDPDKPNPVDTCVKSRTTDEGKACCYLAENVAKWDGKNCVCTGGMKFEIVSGKGVCKPEAQGAKFECPAYLMPLLDSWRVDCAANAQIVALIDQLKQLCAGKDIDEKEFDRLYALIMAMNLQNCAPANIQPDKNAELIRIQAEIKSARIKLDNIKDGFKQTVWKTADGKFNTSRLVSDSVAGVVLGTAGGLITSKVVKKNQIEDGFEDVQCTVGGQVVATWGDSFHVGIQ